MKRFIFILLSNLFFLSVINAQQVTNLTATANNDTIQVSCTLETDVLCSLQLQYSENNGIWRGKMKKVENLEMSTVIRGIRQENRKS